MSTVLVGVVMEGEAVAANYLDVRLLAMLASVFVPLVVNFLSKKTASDGLKAVINIVATAVVTVLSLWINPSGQEVTVWLAVNTFIAAVIASFVAYKGVWKPTGVSGTIAEKTANIGFGSPPTAQLPDKGAEEGVDTPHLDAIAAVTHETGPGLPDPSLSGEELALDVPEAGFFAPSDGDVWGEDYDPEKDGPLPEYPEERIVAELEDAVAEVNASPLTKEN